MLFAAQRARSRRPAPIKPPPSTYISPASPSSVLQQAQAEAEGGAQTSRIRLHTAVIKQRPHHKQGPAADVEPTTKIQGGVTKARIKPMPRIVPGTARAQIRAKIQHIFAAKRLAHHQKSDPIPSRPAIGVAMMLKNVVSRIASMPRPSISFQWSSDRRKINPPHLAERADQNRGIHHHDQCRRP